MSSGTGASDATTHGTNEEQEARRQRVQWQRSSEPAATEARKEIAPQRHRAASVSDALAGSTEAAIVWCSDANDGRRLLDGRALLVLCRAVLALRGSPLSTQIFASKKRVKKLARFLLCSRGR